MENATRKHEVTNTEIFMAYLCNTIFYASKDRKEQIENEIMLSVTDKESKEALKTIFDLTKNIQMID